MNEMGGGISGSTNQIGKHFGIWAFLVTLRVRDIIIVGITIIVWGQHSNLLLFESLPRRYIWWWPNHFRQHESVFQHLDHLCLRGYSWDCSNAYTDQPCSMRQRNRRWEMKILWLLAAAGVGSAAAAAAIFFDCTHKQYDGEWHDSFTILLSAYTIMELELATLEKICGSISYIHQSVFACDVFVLHRWRMSKWARTTTKLSIDFNFFLLFCNLVWFIVVDNIGFVFSFILFWFKWCNIYHIIVEIFLALSLYLINRTTWKRILVTSGRKKREHERTKNNCCWVMLVWWAGKWYGHFLLCRCQCLLAKFKPLLVEKVVFSLKCSQQYRNFYRSFKSSKPIW